MDFFEKYAPSAREAYVSASNPVNYDMKVTYALRGLRFDTLKQVLHDASCNHLPGHISHHIIRLDPNITRGPLVSIPTECIFAQIEKFVIQGDTNRQRELYTLFLHSPFSRENAGWILGSAFSLEKGECKAVASAHPSRGSHEQAGPLEVSIETRHTSIPGC